MLSPFSQDPEDLLRFISGWCCLGESSSFLEKLCPTVFGITYNHRLMHSSTAKENKSWSREGGLLWRLGDVAQ